MSRSNLRWAVIVLTAITGLIHLYLGIRTLTSGDASFTMLGTLWLLNGLGYSGLFAANFANVPYFKDNRGLALYLLIGFAILTIIAWVFLGGILKGEPQHPLAYPDKIDEVLLVIAGFLYSRSK